MQSAGVDRRSLWDAAVADGRPPLLLFGLCLVLAGGFALFQSGTGHFLPHDAAYLGMSADELCSLNECRIVHFMVHDRVSFGGTLVALGVLYLWLVEFPLRQGAAWAWWTLAISGVLGFGSFLAYLGYGYLDTWHGAATLCLLPPFVVGLASARRLLQRDASVRALFVPGAPLRFDTLGLGRMALLATAVGLASAGATIMAIGMTAVFVPQDLEFMGVSRAELHAINPRLIPLIAHDRAGFGGGVCTAGFLVAAIVWCARPSPNLWQALAVAGTVGFAGAVFVHPAVGYTDAFHLAPAVLGSLSFATGMALSYRGMMHAADGD